MSGWMQHLMVVPVLLPLLTGAVMLLLDERRRSLKAMLNLASTLALVVVAVLLLDLTHAAGPPDSASTIGVYLLGNWAAPFGIVLVADRLSALMLLLTSTLALASLLFSLARWHRAGPHFHPLFQLLLMGLNGAFLTGDLFNLFVFFEVLLAASYGLVLHGSGIRRVKAGLHYIAINLTASLLFLIGVALLYGVTGTLNMADLAVRIPTVAAEDQLLLQAGAAILGVAFLVKAGMWPLCFWLPTTYSAASPPAAALFAIMSKVGVYVILRLWLLLFGDPAGAAAQFGGDWLLYGGMITIGFGTIGALASQDMTRLAGYNVLISSGTLLAVIAMADLAVTAGALYYLISSTLTISAFYLLIELAERGRHAGADILAVTLEAYGEAEEEPLDTEEEVGIAIPATMAILGLSFVLCALLLIGLPPLSGFIAKFALLAAILGTSGSETVSVVAWLLLAIIILSGMAVVIAMTRAGIRTFWTPLGHSVPRVRLIEITPIALLLLLCLALTVQAGPALHYMQTTARALHAPQGYIDSVLAAPRTISAQAGKP
jgi:multicomponent K+:H+ antiporter subunit D